MIKKIHEICFELKYNISMSMLNYKIHFQRDITKNDDDFEWKNMNAKMIDENKIF